MKKIEWIVLAVLLVIMGATTTFVAQVTTTYSRLSDGIATAYLAKVGPSILYSFQVTNTLSAAPYARFYDSAVLPICTSATGINSRFIIPAQAAGSGGSFTFPIGKNFSSGVGVCMTANISDTDNTAVSASSVAFNLDIR